MGNQKFHFFSERITGKVIYNRENVFKHMIHDSSHIMYMTSFFVIISIVVEILALCMPEDLFVLSN